MSSTAPKRIASLDLLRFFSAFCVVIYHYIGRPEASSFGVFQDFAQFGYLGVPVFFMISGYVIALSAEGRTPRQFAVSRFVRLYPALWVGVLFTTIVLLFVEGSEINYFQVITNFTLLNDYLGFDNIDGVYWTLQTELKFYACVFVLLLLGVFEYYRVWLTIWLALTACFIFTDQPFFLGWFISPHYSPFFIVGICFYLIDKDGFRPFSVSILTLATVLCFINANDQAGGFLLIKSDQAALVSSFLVLAFIFLFLLIAMGVIALKSSKLTVSLGALTYPLYLLHNSAGTAMIDSVFTKILGEYVSVVLVTLLMLVISFIVYRLVELPVSKRLKALLLPAKLEH